MNRENSGTFVVGAVLLVVGFALLVDRMGLLPWTGQWSVWPLLLIGYGVVNLAESPWRGARGVFPIALGLWLWAAEAGWIEFRNSWPLIFVMLGLTVMWQTWATPADAPDQVLGMRRRRRRNPLVVLAIIPLILIATASDASRYGMNLQSQASGDRMRVMAMMGQAQRAPTDAPFTGADVVTVMGQTTLDLRQAKVADNDDVTVDLFGMMGSILIRVPAGWTVDNRAFPVIGEIIDRRGQPEPLPRARNRGRGRTDDWNSQGTNGSNGSMGSNGSGAEPLAPLEPIAPVEPGTHHRLVITGFVMMGNVVLR